MSKKVSEITQEELSKIPFNNKNVSIGDIDSHIRNIITEKGFTVSRTIYRANSKKDSTLGIYVLDSSKDPYIKPAIGWSNVYGKTCKLQIAIGGFLPWSSSTIFSKYLSPVPLTSEQLLGLLEIRLEDINKDYDDLRYAMSDLKSLSMTPEQDSEIIGILSFDKKVLTSEQISSVKEYFKSYRKGNTLWETYQGISYGLKKAHPKNWMQDQIEVFNLMREKAGIKVNTSPIPKTELETI